MLRTRILSALVLAPPFLACVYIGSPWFELLFAVIGALMGWEWSRITHRGRFTLSGAIMIAALGAVPLVMLGGSYALSIAVIIGASSAVFLMDRAGRETGGWEPIGQMYLGLTLFCVVFLYREAGWISFLFLLFAVWATDTGAYFAGRAIGGPKLAPSISPNKTWAGLAGGALAAAFVMAVCAAFLEAATIAAAAGAAALLAVVAQMGDLFESHVKRRFGVKDSSQLIPGHGGLLDRFDGVLAAAPAAVIVVMSLGGFGPVVP